MERAGLLILLVMVAVMGLHALARRLRAPSPILLVLGGIAIGFLPGIPPLELPPGLVLVAVLPPLLFAAAFYATPRDLKADSRTISLMAVVLVLWTLGTVALAAHLLVGMSWPAALTLGAIVGPTDPITATTIVRRIGVPRRVLTLLEGEGLFNDATALIAYRFTVAAALGSGITAGEVAWRFVVEAAGGVLVGLAVGWLAFEVRRRSDEPMIGVTVSLAAAYGAYLPAQRLGVSGVLAVLACGVYFARRIPTVGSASSRLLALSFWEVLVFLLNAGLFIMIGLQLPGILGRVAHDSPVGLLTAAAALTATVLATRFLWFFSVPYVIRALDRRPTQLARRVRVPERLVVAWSGMRGAVSLALASALPASFPHRDYIVFLTFGVVFGTLVVPGLTLPAVVHRLGLHDDGAPARDEARARLLATEAALVRLEQLSMEDWARREMVERLETAYRYRRQQLALAADDRHEPRFHDDRRLARELVEVQRRVVFQLRDGGAITTEALHRIERDLDLERSLLDQ